MKLILTRHKDQHTKNQVTGTLKITDAGSVVFECKTLELPWKNNERRVSCILPDPDDPSTKIYVLKRTNQSPSFKYPHLDILDTPDRTAVKIHAGNYHTQILGCVLVGESLVDMNNDGELDVTSSRKTLDKIMALVPEFSELQINWV
jgi:hypothetical protein